MQKSIKYLLFLTLVICNDSFSSSNSGLSKLGPGARLKFIKSLKLTSKNKYIQRESKNLLSEEEVNFDSPHCRINAIDKRDGSHLDIEIPASMELQVEKSFIKNIHSENRKFNIVKLITEFKNLLIFFPAKVERKNLLSWITMAPINLTMPD